MVLTVKPNFHVSCLPKKRILVSPVEMAYSEAVPPMAPVLLDSHTLLEMQADLQAWSSTSAKITPFM